MQSSVTTGVVGTTVGKGFAGVKVGMLNGGVVNGGVVNGGTAGGKVVKGGTVGDVIVSGGAVRVGAAGEAGSVLDGDIWLIVIHP